MAKKIETWAELLEYYKQPIFVVQKHSDPRIQEVGFWAINGRFYGNPDRLWFEEGRVHSGNSFQVNPSNMHSRGTFYTGIPEDFHGWISGEENSRLEYARLTGTANSKLKIIYDPCSNNIVPNAKAEKFSRDKIAYYEENCPLNSETSVGTDYMFSMFEFLVMRGEVPAENVEFYYMKDHKKVPMVFSEYKGIKYPDDVELSWHMALSRKIMATGLENMMRMDKKVDL